MAKMSYGGFDCAVRGVSKSNVITSDKKMRLKFMKNPSALAGTAILAQATLVPVLELGPGFGEGWLEVVADEDGIVLPLHSVIGSDGWPLIHAAAPGLGIFEVPLEQDDVFAGVSSRSPIVVILMRADRLGQSVMRAEEVDGARSAVVVGEDCRVGALFRRERIVDA